MYQCLTRRKPQSSEDSPRTGMEAEIYQSLLGVVKEMRLLNGKRIICDRLVQWWVVGDSLNAHFLFPFLVGYVEEWLWWPIQIQSPNIGRKKKASSEEDGEIRSSLLILDLKDRKL